MTAEEALAPLEAGSYESPGDAIGMLALAVAAINREMDEADPGRIKKLVDRLFETVRNVADDYDAHGFSVSVALPLGVSVSVDWAVEDD